MKRFLTLTLFASMALMGHAQEIYRITEPITATFRNVVIDSGCYVKLVAADTNMITVETLNPDSLLLHPVATCEGKTLHITFSPYALPDSAIILSLSNTKTYIDVNPDGLVLNSPYSPHLPLIADLVEVNGVIIVDDTAESYFSSKGIEIRRDTVRRKAGFFLQWTLDASYKLSLNAPTFDNPYTTGRSGFSVYFPSLTFRFPITRKMELYPSLKLGLTLIPFQNKVEYSNGALQLKEDATSTTPRNLMLRTDLNMPIILGFYNNAHHQIFHAGIEFTRLIRGTLWDMGVSEYNRWQFSKQKTQIYNPWQISLMAGFKYGVGVDFYLNLLPTYRADIGAPKIHECGILFTF